MQKYITEKLWIAVHPIQEKAVIDTANTLQLREWAQRGTDTSNTCPQREWTVSERDREKEKN